MLRNLLKYEIKATARWFLPLYVVLLVFACINRLLLSFSTPDTYNVLNLQGIATAVSMTAYVAVMAGIIAITVIIMIQRFYKSLLGSEGYLMFTLPVHTWKHIVSKLLVSMLWIISSTFFSGLSILFTVVTPESWQKFTTEIAELYGEFSTHFGNTTFLFMGEFGFAMLIGIAESVLMIYTAIALGQLFSKYKLLASFGMYIALNTVKQILSSVVMMLLGNTLFKGLSDANVGVAQIHGLMIVAIAICLALCAGYFILTQYLLKNKLNLE